MKKLRIIYEDKYLIIVNKPTGEFTISRDNHYDNNLYDEVKTYVKKQNPKNKIFIVHRLDKDTSGIVVFAKSERVKESLQNTWDYTERNYIAVVHGITKDKDTIKSYLKETKTLYTYSTNDKSGKYAETSYKKIKSNKQYSLLKINIKTGRKNQIRVHMKEFGHPIIGDKKYDSRKNPIRRLGLHANILIIKNPITKKDMEFKAKIPKQFNSIFKIV